LLVGKSQSHLDLVGMIEKVRNVGAPVFIRGESGTGKELVARSIHIGGIRRNGNFVALNCSAIPEHLLESELFGFAKGAFTGAARDKPGLIEEAHGGTFFLDEIGDLSPGLQAKLLRVVENKEVRRVGENRMREVSTRFISATNKNIEDEINRGRFREDLYYRLKIITIELLPLRERKQDVLQIIDHFLDKYTKEMDLDPCVFSSEAIELLLDYSWPGNVRELENEVQKCLIMCRNQREIKAEHLSDRINNRKSRRPINRYDLSRARADFEKKFVHQALMRFGYHRSRTAQELGLSRQGLFKLIKKHNIEIPLRT